MSRGKKLLRNMIVLGLLLYVFLNRSSLYLNPLSAHEDSERSIHYGPSEVVHIENFEGGKYVLGKYDKWVSCNMVSKVFFFLWGFGSDPTGFENDQTKAVDYTWAAINHNFKLYGIINDDRVKKIEITLGNGKVLIQTDFYDDLFLFTWRDTLDEDWNFKNIRGYDANNNIIFEEEY